MQPYMVNNTAFQVQGVGTYTGGLNSVPRSASKMHQSAGLHKESRVCVPVTVYRGFTLLLEWVDPYVNVLGKVANNGSASICHTADDLVRSYHSTGMTRRTQQLVDCGVLLTVGVPASLTIPEGQYQVGMRSCKIH